VEVPDIALDRAGGDVRNSLTASTASSTDGGGPLFCFYQGPSEYLEFWVLDVQGQRLIIEKPHLPRVDPELDAVVDSIRIQREGGRSAADHRRE
jgi:hypothetical protein